MRISPGARDAATRVALRVIGGLCLGGAGRRLLVTILNDPWALVDPFGLSEALSQAVWIAAGSGLLRLKAWGRRWSLFAAVISILVWIAGGIRATRLAIATYRRSGGEADPYWLVLSTEWASLALRLVGALFLIWVLTRRRIKAQCGARS